MPTEAMADRMHHGLMNLSLALADAELASTAARGLAGRSLAVALARSLGRRDEPRAAARRTGPYARFGSPVGSEVTPP